MNGTFMFGEDRFSESEDFSKYYHEISGVLPRDELNTIITLTYEYLDERYPDMKYRNNFPSVEEAVTEITKNQLPENEIIKIISTFAFHELGHIPDEYVKALHKLNSKFVLAAVVDIWSPKKAWLEIFKKHGIYELFHAFSFSSDHRVVKPSPTPFDHVVGKLGLQKNECIVIGDSPRRDLGGAKAAGIDCILVGGAEDKHAVAEFSSLLEFSDTLV